MPSGTVDAPAAAPIWPVVATFPPGPDNRLVFDNLKADWNDASRAHQTARESYEHASAATGATLPDELKERMR